MHDAGVKTSRTGSPTASPRSSSMRFVYLHVVWFTFWIAFGVEVYPYGLLTMTVSTQAIFLSTFVMISQNRADAKRELLANQEWKTVQGEDEQNQELLRVSHQILDLTKAVHASTSAGRSVEEAGLQRPLHVTGRTHRSEHRPLRSNAAVRKMPEMTGEVAPGHIVSRPQRAPAADDSRLRRDRNRRPCRVQRLSATVGGPHRVGDQVDGDFGVEGMSLVCSSTGSTFHRAPARGRVVRAESDRPLEVAARHPWHRSRARGPEPPHPLGRARRRQAPPMPVSAHSTSRRRDFVRAAWSAPSRPSLVLVMLALLLRSRRRSREDADALRAELGPSPARPLGHRHQTRSSRSVRSVRPTRASTFEDSLASVPRCAGVLA